VEAYRQLVRPVAIHYARCSRESSEDLLQVGMMGLIRAAELFTDDRRTPFEAFARPHIRGAMLHYLRDVAPRVRLPRRQAELMERCQRASGGTGEAPLGAEAQARSRQDLGVGDEQWQLFLRHRCLNRALPFEEQPLREREQGVPPCRVWEGQSMDADAPGEPQQEPTGGGVEQMLKLLDHRERQVVERVVLLGESYRKVAADLAISPMTVQRALRRGLDQLRQRLQGRGFTSGRMGDPAPSGSPEC
jgi:RNA polymerase sigma-B factor